jgi:DNA-binding NarL/FixJ family response regulator
MERKIRIILADDYALVREALAMWLGRQPDVQIVALCSTVDEALAATLQSEPDVLLLDIDMPGQGAFEAARTIAVRLPATRVVFLSAFVRDGFIEQALAVRAAGYLTKGESLESLAAAIRATHAGRTCFSACIRARMVVGGGGTRLADAPRTRTKTLSRRENEILRYLARALSRKEIAQTVRLSVHTVDRHTANLMRKLDIHSRTELCRFAIREGLAEP